MSLSDRLADARAKQAEAPKKPSKKRRRPAAPPPDLRRRVHQGLLDVLGPQLYDPDLGAEELGVKVQETLGTVLDAEQQSIAPRDRERLVVEITDDVLGYGPLEPLLQDPTVTEVMVNGPDTVYVERDGRIVLTDTRFVDDAHLRRVIEKIVAQVGRRIDEAQPYVDARLPDGSRVNAVIPPVAIDGPALTIRRFSHDPYTVEDLIRFGSLTEPLARFLEACVRGRLNVLVSGGTGVGKTTMLNVLSSSIPADERIVTIEDAAELKLLQPHVVRLEQRPPNVEGRGAVPIRDLVRNALRMRPDRIVVGEVRGGEALDMLQAMNTGHDGSISTVHSNGPRDALARLETMVLMAGMDLPIRAIRQQVASAIQLIVHLSRTKDGVRRVTHVTELTGMEGDVITLQDLFLFDYGMGRSAEGRFQGHVKATGLRPTFAEHLADLGEALPSDLFAPEAMQRGGRR